MKNFLKKLLDAEFVVCLIWGLLMAIGIIGILGGYHSGADMFN